MRYRDFTQSYANKIQFPRHCRSQYLKNKTEKEEKQAPSTILFSPHRRLAEPRDAPRAAGLAALAWCKPPDLHGAQRTRKVPPAPTDSLRKNTPQLFSRGFSGQDLFKNSKQFRRMQRSHGSKDAPTRRHSLRPTL